MRFTKGINQDVDPSAQPEGTYRDLMNGVLNDKTGSIVKDRPTQEVTDLQVGDTDVKGSITIPEQDRAILFVYANSQGNSKILNIDLENNSVISILTDDPQNQRLQGTLDFDQADYVDASYSINNNGELIIYWTDGVNPPRFYNVTKGNDIVDYKLNVFPHYNSSNDQSNVEFTLNEINDSGGSLSGGSYQLAFAYIDNDGTLTNYFYVTRPIRIYNEEYNSIVDRFRYIGLDDEDQTSKSIEFILSDLDTNYDKVRVSAIKGTNVANVQDISIPDSGNLTYNYTGNEDEVAGSLDEISINQPSYDAANTITQHNNQMFMGGLKESGLTRSEKEDLQASALNIEVDYTTEKAYPQSAGPSPDKQLDFLTVNTGFKRGETYALYISFLRDDGRETEAFHIPGRPPTIGNEKDKYSNGGITFSERYKALAEPDSTHNMGYWENSNESYPNAKPFNSETTTDINGGTVPFSEVNIRHHRIPGPTYTGNRPTSISNNNREANVVGLELNNISVPNSLSDKIVGWKLYYAKKNEGDRLIIDQGSFNAGWVDKSSTGNPGDSGYRPYQNGDKVFKDDKYVTFGFDENHEHDGDGDGIFESEEWGSDTGSAYGRPAESMIERNDLSGVTHLRGIEKIEYNHQPTISQYNLQNANDNRTEITGPHEGTEEDDWFVGVTSGPVYVDAGVRNVNLSEKYNFDYDMDNLFGESKVVMELNSNAMTRGYRTIFDMCVRQDDVHTPYDRQELVDTGQIGYINSNGDGQSLVVRNGDTYISENTYNATTLLALLDDDDNKWDNAFDKFWIEDISSELPVDGGTKREGVRKGIQEQIGTKGNINITPFPVSHSYDSFVESRIPTGLISDGESSKYDLRAPRTGASSPWRTVPHANDLEPSTNEYDKSNSPPAKQIIIARLWAEYFNRSDNYPQWNEEYADLNTVKTAFPWDPSDIEQNQHYNRIIRSSGNPDSGTSKSFRRFRSEDFLDVKENRGEILNLTEYRDNLIIHLERSLIQTRGKERIKTTGGQEAFIGSGDIFNITPSELNVTELGFAGLHSFSAQNKSESGYFFVDKDANSIYWLSESQGFKELTTEQFGLSEFFDEKLRNTDINPIVGYDADSGRVMFTLRDISNSTNTSTLSFYPSRPAWGSRHSYHPDYYIDALDTLSTIKDDTLYLHKEGVNSGIYGVDRVFQFKYAVPHGFNNKVDHVWVNADHIDLTSGVITEHLPIDTMEVENSTQTTGNMILNDYDSGTPTDITDRGNIRKTQGVWRVHDIRETGGGPSYLPSWAQDPRLEDDHHIVTIEKAASDDSIILRAAGLQSEQTIH